MCICIFVCTFIYKYTYIHLCDKSFAAADPQKCIFVDDVDVCDT